MRFLVVFVLFAACFAVRAQNAPPVVLNERLITKLPPNVVTAMTTQFDYWPWGQAVQWSGDMKRVASWVIDKKGLFAVVNGVVGPTFDVIDDGSPRGAVEPPWIVFSPDSQHYAYVARRGKKHFVVNDNKIGAAYDWIAPDDLHFSADSTRMAYWARRGQKNLTVLHDGDKIKEFGFTPRKTDAPQNFYNEDVLASRIPSWKIIERDNKKIVVFRGQESAPYDSIYDENPYYSADYQHAAWRAERDGKLFLILDGIEADITYPTAPGLRLPPVVFGTNELHTLMKRGNEIWRVEVEIADK